ncbi:MAG: hypothetical protein ABIN94_01115 [Ferruginibacter sp.]
MLSANTVLTATPLDEVIRHCIELMIPVMEASIKEAIKQQVDERLISPAQACKLFDPSISIVTLNKWSKDSRIPVQRIGGRVYYKTSDVMKAAKSIVKYKKA